MSENRAQSVKVINEARRFEDIIKYEEFCNAQELMLWTGEPGWRPGDPMYMDPRVRRLFFDDMGETARYMVDIFEIDPEAAEYRDGARKLQRCRDCFVSWPEEDAPCWMCGKEWPLEKRKEGEPRLLYMSSMGSSFQDFSRLLYGVDFDGDTDLTVMEWGITHEPDNDYDREANAQRWRAAQRRMARQLFGELDLPFDLMGEDLQYGSTVDELQPFPYFQHVSWTGLTEVEPYLGPSLAYRVETVPEPVINPTLTETLYDPSVPRPYRVPQVISRAVFEADLSAQRHIPEPVITRGNPRLDAYVAEHGRHYGPEERPRRGRTPLP